ncbi:MAG: MFS transporter [Bryobacterales bacterium]|nr:MFS transporter [Bryobacterales bacterium]
MRHWLIVALLGIATAINYIDRQTLSILSPQIRAEFHLSEQDYANIVTAFLVPYTLMYALGGRLMDAIGVRLGLSLALGWWSIATMLTAWARGPLSLAFFRFLLGLGEPCVFPAGVKVCGEWFPPHKRGIATGIFSSGSSLGAILAPPLIAAITLRFGWQYAFWIPGALGLLWLPLWWFTYRPNPAAAATRQPAVPWRLLLRERRVWGLILPRFFSDPVWYFYIFWLPDYLQRERHLSLAEIGFYGWIPFLFADLGHLLGGGFSDWLVRRGLKPQRARIIVLTSIGCIAPLGAIAGIVPTPAMAIGVTCLVAMLTQAWSTNTASLCADTIPNEQTASVFGLMGFAGSLAGAFFAQILGVVIQNFGYPAAFALAAMLHPTAAILLRVMFRGRT